MDTYVDYDAAFAEAHAQPLVRRLYGRDWVLPAVPPASVVLHIARLVADGRSETEFTVAELLSIAAELIPPDVLREWTDRGLDTDRLSFILTDLLNAYAPYFAGGSDPEATTPGTPTSSSVTGVSSQPTSTASTASVSLAT